LLKSIINHTFTMLENMLVFSNTFLVWTSLLNECLEASDFFFCCELKIDSFEGLNLGLKIPNRIETWRTIVWTFFLINLNLSYHFWYDFWISFLTIGIGVCFHQLGSKYINFGVWFSTTSLMVWLFWIKWLKLIRFWINKLITR
jgi:hypothetical protein